MSESASPGAPSGEASDKNSSSSIKLVAQVFVHVGIVQVVLGIVGVGVYPAVAGAQPDWGSRRRISSSSSKSESDYRS